MACSNFHRGKYYVTFKRGFDDCKKDITVSIDKVFETDSLRISLSDEDDPTFLCILAVTRIDYEDLKKQQGLLIDFDNFPAQLVRLLQQCASNNMFLIMQQSNPVQYFLEIVEHNEFKRLVHLSLRTGPATDADVKQHMAESIRNLKKTLSAIKSSSSSSEALWNDKCINMERRINDLSHALTKMEEDQLRREAEYQEALRQEKDRLAQERVQWQKNLEMNSKSQLSSTQETLNRKERQIEEINEVCKKLRDNISQLENQLSEKSQRLNILEAEVQKSHIEVATLKAKNSGLEREVKDKERQHTQLNIKCDVLEKNLKEQSDTIMDLKNTLHMVKREKCALEDRLNLSESLAAKQNEAAHSTSEQLLKANQIISKQNADLIEMKEKLLCRTAIALEQEKVIERNSKQTEGLKAEVRDAKETVAKIRSELDGLRETCDTTEKALKDKDETIKNNNMVIQWLHKKLEDNCVPSDAIQSKNAFNSPHVPSNSSTPYFLPRSVPHNSSEESINFYATSKLSNIDSPRPELQEKTGKVGLDPKYLKPAMEEKNAKNKDTHTALEKSSVRSNERSILSPVDNIISTSAKIPQKATVKKNSKKMVTIAKTSAQSSGVGTKSSTVTNPCLQLTNNTIKIQKHAESLPKNDTASILMPSKISSTKPAMKLAMKTVSPTTPTAESFSKQAAASSPSNIAASRRMMKPAKNQVIQGKPTAESIHKNATATSPASTSKIISQPMTKPAKKPLNQSKPTVDSIHQDATASSPASKSTIVLQPMKKPAKKPLNQGKPTAESIHKNATATSPASTSKIVSQPMTKPAKKPLNQGKPTTDSIHQDATASSPALSNVSLPKPASKQVTQGKPTAEVSSSENTAAPNPNPFLMLDHSYCYFDVGSCVEIGRDADVNLCDETADLNIDAVAGINISLAGKANNMGINDDVDILPAENAINLGINDDVDILSAAPAANIMDVDDIVMLDILNAESANNMDIDAAAIDILPAEAANNMDIDVAAVDMLPAETANNMDDSLSASETLQQLKNKTRDWSFDYVDKELPNFTEKMATTKDYTNRSVPVDYFDDMFPEAIIEMIVENTNKYAEFMYSSKWKPTNKAEIRAYLGIIILMGVHPLPKLTLYWSSDPFFNNPVISAVMTCQRFKKITENLHLNDKSAELLRTHAGYDKLCKIRPIMDILNQTFQENCTQSQRQSIDESMVKFKGRSTMKQYMPKKPIKRGYKVWARCDAETGYLYQFQVYTGKAQITDDGDGGLGYNVVTQLCRNVQPNTLVAFDNFFTGLPLMEMLYQKEIYSVGTIRNNRKGLPEYITKKSKDTKLNTGEFIMQCAPPVSVIKWRDTKDVFICTTGFNPKEVVTIKRTQKDGSKKPMYCPRAIAEYTQTMGGVDRLDHFRSSYSIGRKSRKNWFRLFWFMTEVASINAYVVYSQTHKKTNNSHMDFRVALGRGLINNETFHPIKPPVFINKRGGVYGVPDTIRLANVGAHMPSEDSYRRCRYCSTRAKVRRTKTICVTCKVPLCTSKCFLAFHTRST